MSKSIISGNGPGDWLRMPQGLCIVLASCDDWSTTEVAFESAINSEGDEAEPIYGPSDHTTAMVASGSTGRNFTIFSDGDMAVRATVSNYGGSPVTVRVRASITNKSNLI